MEIALLLSAAEFAPPRAKGTPPTASSPVGVRETAADDKLLREISAATETTSPSATCRPPAPAPPAFGATYAISPAASRAITSIPSPYASSSTTSLSPSAPYPQAPWPPAGNPPQTPTPRPSPPASARAPSASPRGIPAPLPAIGKDGKLKRFLCPFAACAVRFGQKGSLTRHIRSRHEHRRPHACTHCAKSFSEKWTLDVHVRNVHLKQQPHACATCGKSFGERWNLQKHVNVVHRRIKPFRCGICDRAFGYKGDMRKHVNELHRTPGRPFRCEETGCGVNFARLRYLRRHQNTAHGGRAGLGAERAPVAHAGARRSSAEVAAQASAVTSVASEARGRDASAASVGTASVVGSVERNLAVTGSYSGLHALSACAESALRAETAGRR